MENFHPPHLKQNTNTNEDHNQLNLQLQEMLDKCVPEKIVKQPKNTKFMVQSYLMWTAKNSLKQRKNLEEILGAAHWKAYTMERNRYIHQIHYFKQKSISKRVPDCKRDTKELFCLVNKLTGNTQH